MYTFFDTPPYMYMRKAFNLRNRLMDFGVTSLKFTGQLSSWKTRQGLMVSLESEFCRAAGSVLFCSLQENCFFFETLSFCSGPSTELRAACIVEDNVYHSKSADLNVHHL